LRTEVAKGLTLEIVKLKLELVVSAKNLKKALDANLVQGDQVKKLEAERDALKARCQELERQRQAQVDENKKLEQFFARSLRVITRLSLKLNKSGLS